MPSIIDAIKPIFYDTSNRPKKFPVHESALQRKLEEEYSPREVRTALHTLQRKKILDHVVTNTKFTGKVKFYYSYKLGLDQEQQSKVLKKIKRLCYWIDRYSNPKITSMLGTHLYSLVKSELKTQEFEIVNEGNAKSYNGKIWPYSEHGLDLIGRHKKKNIVIGVEVKNTLDLIPYGEIQTKIKMCKYFGITPIFACRWLKPYEKDIKLNGGFPWQFRIQMYPLGQERFVEEIRKRFNFLIDVRTELPKESVTSFEKWVELR